MLNMSTATIKKVRGIRSKGKKQLILINDKLNALAWELSSDNEAVSDPNVAKAVATMDEALETLQVAMVLLNTVSVDPSMLDAEAAALAEKMKPKAAKPSMFSRKDKAEPMVGE